MKLFGVKKKKKRERQTILLFDYVNVM